MRADYDSEANALSIGLIQFDPCDDLDGAALRAAAQAALAAPDRLVELEVAAQVAV